MHLSFANVTRLKKLLMRELATQLHWRCVFLLPYLPIKTLEKAGIILKNDPKKEHTEDTSEEVILFENLDFETEETDTNKSSYHNKSIDQLHEILTKAVADEDYETAAKVRDEISKR